MKTPLRKSESTKPVPPAVEPDKTPAPEISRIAFATTPDRDGVLWDNLKNDASRNRLRTLIQNEAHKMGYVKPSPGEAVPASDDVVNASDLCGLISMGLVAVALQTIPRCTPAQAEALTIQPHHVNLINKGGACDRVLAKYTGTFKYKDEVTVLIGLSVASASIAQAFLDAHKTAAGKPARVLPMSEPSSERPAPAPASVAEGEHQGMVRDSR